MTRKVAAVVIAVFTIGATLAITSSAGAQDQANPWFVDKYDAVEDTEIIEVRPNGRVAFSVPLARVYGLDEEYFVTAGVPLTSICLGHVPPQATLITYRSNGKFVTKTPPGGLEVATYVYARGAVEGDIFAFFDAACGGWATEGTPLPNPVASGLATLRINSNPAIPMWATFDQPEGHYRNGVSGTLADVDGNLWDLSARANYKFDPSAQGPPDFVVHDVSLTPSAG